MTYTRSHTRPSQKDLGCVVYPLNNKSLITAPSSHSTRPPHRRPVHCTVHLDLTRFIPGFYNTGSIKNTGDVPVGASIFNFILLQSIILRLVDIRKLPMLSKFEKSANMTIKVFFLYLFSIFFAISFTLWNEHKIQNTETFGNNSLGHTSTFVLIIFVT
jgi:hypothetical protein